MNGSQHSRIANFIWGIADDVLRDLYVRGKYRDVILPMTVLRRLDAVLEPTKEAVLDMKTTRQDLTALLVCDWNIRNQARPQRSSPSLKLGGRGCTNTLIVIV